MPLERTRRSKVNINFSNFETIAVNLFHDPLEIGLRDLRNLGKLIHAVKSAEPLPVSNNGHDALLTDPDYRA